MTPAERKNNTHHQSPAAPDYHPARECHFSATGSGRVGFIDAADIARAAVSALLEDRSWNRDFILTGPETLSYADVASKLSGILGRTIRHVNLGVNILAERYRVGGLDKDYAQTLASMDKWTEDGN